MNIEAAQILLATINNLGESLDRLTRQTLDLLMSEPIQHGQLIREMLPIRIEARRHMGEMKRALANSQRAWKLS